LQSERVKEQASMATFEFLSDEWISEAKKIREEHDGGKAVSVSQPVKMNLVVTEVPFGDGSVRAHLDTTAGSLELDLDHLEGADLTVTLDYLTAKAMLIDGNPAAGMQAFMAGKIRVEGDMAKLMALQAAQPDPSAIGVADRLRAMTA
jgi:hypothetical protein